MSDTDFFSRYNEQREWHRKVLVMQMYHALCLHSNKHWKLGDTAKYFGVSIGLVSENLRLAKAFDDKPEIMKLDSRQKALDAIDRRRFPRIKMEDDDE